MFNIVFVNLIHMLCRNITKDWNSLKIKITGFRKRIKKYIDIKLTILIFSFAPILLHMYKFKHGILNSTPLRV